MNVIKDIREHLSKLETMLTELEEADDHARADDAAKTSLRIVNEAAYVNLKCEGFPLLYNNVNEKLERKQPAAADGSSYIFWGEERNA